MPDDLPSEPLPVPGYTGRMPLPRWSEYENVLILEAGVPGGYLKLFLGISGAIFGLLAGFLFLLASIEETFREHRTNLLQLFLLVAPALGFFLATLVNRTCAALWGSVYFVRESGIVFKRRWKDRFRIPLERAEAIQLCREADGRGQLNLVFRGSGGARERRFLFHHSDREALRAFGERLAESCELDFVESG